jgi:hypothetical protein
MPKEKTMSERIFLSYSHRDQEFVSKLATDLETRGAQVWIDRGDIHAGAVWRDSIATAVQGCQAFILVISSDAIDSEYVGHEISMAVTYQKPVFPIIYRKTKIPGYLASQIHNYQILDFTRGGYENNLTDLLRGLSAQGVPLAGAPELIPQEREARRRELLGAPVKVKWGTVFSKIPGWAFAWGLGWVIFWLVLMIASLLLSEDSSTEGMILMPLGGFGGGMIGGLLAGLVTMFALRYNATNIAWKHMKSSIRIWGLVGPIGVLVAGWLAVLFFNSPASGNVDCSSLSFGDCFGSMIGQVFADAIGAVFALIVAIILYALIAIFGIGAVAGWLAVRHIRRLEPGILGKQSVWVVLGWGAGAVVAVIASLIVVAPFLE